MTGGKKTIDFDSALERTGGDKDFLYELIDMYMEDFIPKYDELKKAIKEENFTAIQETGHYLKGSAANLSLSFLKDASLQMELAGEDKDIKKAQQTLGELKKEFARLKTFISNMD
jgi:HPt (histidine-containing phosphotransfer) domain-containing protein